MTCTNCNGTGHNPGSQYLDCAAPGCDAAAMLAALGEWLEHHPDALPADVFQHGRAVERIALGIERQDSTTGDHLPLELLPHLRQYQHNDRSGLLFGFDFEGTRRQFGALLKRTADAEESLRAIRAGHIVTLKTSEKPERWTEFDLSPAMREGALRQKLVELGWTPPGPVDKKPEAWKYRAIGNGEWRVTLNEDWARALNDPNVVPLFVGAAPASQAAAPTDEQIAAIHALARDDAAVHAFMKLKRRDGLGWPDVLAQMVLHLANDKAAITARALELASCTSPAIILAGAAPVEAAKPEPLASFTGTMTEVGDIKAGRGFAIEIAESTYVEVIGLTEAEVTNVAAQFYAGVTIQVIPAAPAPEAQ